MPNFTDVNRNLIFEANRHSASGAITVDVTGVRSRDLSIVKAQLIVCHSATQLREIGYELIHLSHKITEGKE